jgi:hypothetical protein
MSKNGSYKPVSGSEKEDRAVGIFTIDDEGDEPVHETFVEEEEEENRIVEPLEIETWSQDGESEGYSYGEDLPLFTWKEPWLSSVTITLCFVSPILLGTILMFYDLTGRIWAATPFCLHLLANLATARYLIPNASTPAKLPNRILTSLSPLLDILMFGYVYPTSWAPLINYFFTEPDGTTVVEYSSYKERLLTYQKLGLAIVVFRSLIGGVAISTRLATYYFPTTLTACLGRFQSPRPFGTLLDRISCSTNTKDRFKRGLRGALTALVVLSALLVSWSLFSVAAHWIPWPTPVVKNAACDPLDETECVLPFPSFHQMRPDSTTPTGYRVDLKGHLLPPLKGGIRMEPTFLNRLDGFSTMAPMLFYVEGMKEAHENGSSSIRLQGPANIANSVTEQSITLLLDVSEGRLVPHSAEIDYLDPERPLVMVFPARPLRHNGHYALAVVNASDENGNRLPPTPGMTALFENVRSERRSRYVSVIMPALERAAPWFSFPADPDSLQLLFDFPTVSEESQLGPVRAVRDATLSHIQGNNWGSWKDHVRENRIIDNRCEEPGTLIARTVHAELDIPWFLESYGSGHRAAFLDDAAVLSRRPSTMGVGKFVVHIPCSVRAAALDLPGAKPLRAVLEYGHGLFYTRHEASDSFLQRIANDEGYAIIACDWRGMSAFDLLVVAKVLLSTPRLFQGVRDNLIQGYANKYALQHFTRNGMLSMDWFSFQSDQEGSRAMPTPTLDEKPPVTIFYGNSQGGILGAGYTALSGTTGLIDRGVLGVPGTPFALIMSRSLEFQGYDALMLLNFYNNRHVRILLSLVQMAWDSVEGSGALATPVREPFPRMLLQAGLGDVTVPTIAAEALARGFGAMTLPNSPRTIFGVSVANETDNPYVTLTELLYEDELSTLPADDVYAQRNSVHFCMRLDGALIDQMKVFINTGEVIDPCITDGCRRQHADC